MIQVGASITVGERELEERFVRASGPGGQNVNKVATAVELRFDVAASSLPEDVKARLTALAGKRMSAEGVLLIDSRAHRTQAANRAAARERLVELVRRAAVRPKVRRKTRPSGAAKERRIETKVRRGRIKAARGPVRGEE
jgi:ribosome-associated protein